MAFRAIAFIVIFGLMGTACAPEPQTEYTVETEVNFMAGCTDVTSDTLLHARLCQCLYQRLEIVVPYERLKVLDDEMLADPELKLQRDFIDLVADCVIEEGDLNR